ncbi:MAG: hypothetical protein HDR97_01470 [Bacteroides sp.]|nr:hypothetical protein [Bacteroides sp.]
MNDTDRKTQYFLCWIYDGYEIVEHHADEPEGRGGLCFRVDDEALSDGDGFPATYDDSYVQIDEKDHLHVINLFRKTGEAMCECGDKVAKPLDRPIAEGDYLYDGMAYVHIDSVSADGQYRGEDFYYDTYDASIYEETDDLDYIFDPDNSDAEFQLITEDAYREALNILRTAIAEITDYLERLYKSKPHKN